MGVARNPEACDSFTSSGTRTSAACGRPWGQRAVVGEVSASTRPRGVHASTLDQTTAATWNGGRRRRCPSGVHQHQLDDGGDVERTEGGVRRQRRRHSARSTLSTGSTTAERSLSSSASATIVGSRRRTTSVDHWPQEVVTPVSSRLQTTRHVDRKYTDISMCRRNSSELTQIRAFFVNVTNKSANRACRSTRPHIHKGTHKCEQQARNGPGGGARQVITAGTTHRKN